MPVIRVLISKYFPASPSESKPCPVRLKRCYKISELVIQAAVFIRDEENLQIVPRVSFKNQTVSNNSFLSFFFFFLETKIILDFSGQKSSPQQQL